MAFWSIFVRKKLSPDYLYKSHDHDHQWADLVIIYYIRQE